MPKVTLSDISNLSGNPGSAQTVVNSNSLAIETAIENTLSRDGTAPNEMGASLDMNGNDLLNVGDITYSNGDSVLTTGNANETIDDRVNALLVAGSNVTLTYDDTANAITVAATPAALYPQTAAEAAAGVTPSAYAYPPGDVRRYGADPTGVADSTQAILDCMATVTRGGHIRLPTGTYLVTELPLTGKSCGIVGDGVSHTGTALTGSVIKSSAQTGAVLDFTGFNYPDSFRGFVRFEGFGIQGDGTAGAAKYGIYGEVGGGIAMRNIVILNTGGPGIRWDRIYLSSFENITVMTPVSCKANDVPYIHLRAVNGNRFVGLGLQSIVAVDDVPDKGALCVEDDGTYAPHDNLFLGCWVEYLHPDTDQTIFMLKGNTNVVSDFQWFDASKKTGATGTSYMKLAAPSVTDAGGNLIRGLIMGRETSVVGIDYGIHVAQNRNHIDGVKGYRGYNVYLASGVGHTALWLGGSQSGATDPAVDDASGETTNWWFDAYYQTSSQQPTAGALQLTAAGVSSASGVVSLGNGTQTTVGAAGGGSALPATPSGYIKIYIGATQYVLPYYAQA